MRPKLPPPVHLRATAPPRWLVRRHASLPPQVLVGPLLRLGCAGDNELVLLGSDIAARHCSLRRIGDEVWIHDHGSGAGTLVDGTPLREPRLLSGPVRLILGDQALTVEAIAPAPERERVARGFWPRHDPPRRSPPLADRSQKPDGGRPRRALYLHAVVFAGVLFGAAGTSAAVVTDLLHRREDGRSPSPAAPHSPTAHDPPPLVEHPSSARNPEHPYKSRSPRTEPKNLAQPRRHKVRAGETWASIANTQGLPQHVLRSDNKGLRRPLRAGDRIHLPPASSGSSTDHRRDDLPKSCAGRLDIPDGSRSLGGVNLGTLDDPIRLPRHPSYALRCPAHAYATAETTRTLIDAISCFRAAHAYEGQIVIGDISSEQGGPLGPHLSHQSGRDVDLWLPIAGGHYGQGCDHCGTSYCRPQPEEVDWSATWDLIDTLGQFPEVEMIFLDFDLQAKLRNAALANDANPATLDARIQWPRRGAAALVQHAAGHVHHIHIRLRCPPGEEGCIGRPRVSTTFGAVQGRQTSSQGQAHSKMRRP